MFLNKTVTVAKPSEQHCHNLLLLPLLNRLDGSLLFCVCAECKPIKRAAAVCCSAIPDACAAAIPSRGCCTRLLHELLLHTLQATSHTQRHQATVGRREASPLLLLSLLLLLLLLL
jgi:hypothetical protein